jgi:hypothetical protein
MAASRNNARFSTAKEIALAFGGSCVASVSGWRRAEKKPPEELFGEPRVGEPSRPYLPARGLDPAALTDLSRAARFASRFRHAASKAERLVR